MLMRIYLVAHVVVTLHALRWLDRSTQPGATPELLWPVKWMGFLDLTTAATGAHVAAIVAAVLCAAAPQRRVLRVLSLLAFLEVLALSWSYGKVSHIWHAWLWGGACLLLMMPAHRRDDVMARRALRQQALFAVWLAQALLLLFYSLTGFWKVVGLALQLARGQTHVLAPDALAIQIANRLMETGSTSPLGPFVIAHPLVGWPAVIVVLYLELFAVVVAFRPALHRVWAACLIAFHVVVYVTMNIDFSGQVLIVALLFFGSPFAPRGFLGVDALGDLPVVGALVRRAGRVLRRR